MSETGYNVQASGNISIDERQRILKKAIDENKITVNEILNLLELQIHLHSGIEKYKDAVDKWKVDAEFVKSFGIKSEKTKRIKDIEI